ncbi:Oxidoreductase/transition metal ion-binding protein [Quillaja saponaria]|uniref:Oxidoreductase/transition metal ion-binding protein n=1 Tax=Quillaja saponaria TaxID=32244 RepID=A0AAD7LJJ0_QUISA|nr:Oxidoreductase/transition metal ion-binding protein [Quillaja saponaria]
MARYRNDQYYYSFWEYLSFSVHLYFFIAVLLFILGLLWYINYHSAFEDLMIQVKLFLILVPLFLLLLIHCLSTEGLAFLLPFPEKETFHRAGGSPWGVALLLVFLLFMISYQSSFHERWLLGFR